MSEATELRTDDGRRLERWAWDCIDCGGNIGTDGSCDTCAGTNRIPLYALQADVDRFNEQVDRLNVADRGGTDGDD